MKITGDVTILSSREEGEAVHFVYAGATLDTKTSDYDEALGRARILSKRIEAKRMFVCNRLHRRDYDGRPFFNT